MAIAFVSAGATSESGYLGTPVSVAMNATGADLCAVVFVFGTSGLTNSITSATYDGVAMTAITADQVWGGANDHTRAFYLVGANSGTSKTCSVSYSGDISLIDMVCVVFSGVGSVSGGVYQGLAGSSTAPSLTVSTAADDLAVGMFCGATASAAGTPDQDEYYDAAFTALSTYRGYAYGKTAVGASTAVSFSTGSAIFYWAHGLALTPAGAGGSAIGAAAHLYAQLRRR